MKKIISLLLCVIFILSCITFTANAKVMSKFDYLFENDKFFCGVDYIDHDNVTFSSSSMKLLLDEFIRNGRFDKYAVGEKSQDTWWLDTAPCYRNYEIPYAEFGAAINEYYDCEVNSSFIKSIDYCSCSPTTVSISDYHYGLGLGGYIYDAELVAYKENGDKYDLYFEQYCYYYEEDLERSCKEKHLYYYKVSENEYLDHYYKAVAEDFNGHLKYLSVVELENRANDIPADAITKDEVVSIKDGTNDNIKSIDTLAFEKGTVVSAKTVEDEEILKTANETVNKLYANTKISLFDFSAVKDGVKVQPKGKVKVSFNIPGDYNADKTTVVYISDDGKTVRNVNWKLSEDKTAIETELEHFSLYALIECDNMAATTGDSGIGMYLLMMSVFGIGLMAVVPAIKRRKEN